MDQGTDGRALETSRELKATRSEHPFVFSEGGTGCQALAVIKFAQCSHISFHVRDRTQKLNGQSLARPLAQPETTTGQNR